MVGVCGGGYITGVDYTCKGVYQEGDIRMTVPWWVQIVILVILMEGMSVGRGPISMSYKLYKHLRGTESVIEEDRE